MKNTEKSLEKKTWELDALDPKILTCLLEEEIRKLINWTLWEQREQTVKNQKKELENKCVKSLTGLYNTKDG